jgi:hypothetical protein
VGEIMMKKVFFMLFILLMSFGYGENLDNYESKRVFDKDIEMFLTGDYEKYLNDKEMKRVLDSELLKEVIENKGKYTKLINIFKEHKYTVTDVKEGTKESVLTVNVRYKAYDVLEDKYLAALYLSVNSMLGEEERALTLEEFISMYEKMDKLLESKTTIIERTIKVYMNKEAGFWDTDNYNPELNATVMLCKDIIY